MVYFRSGYWPQHFVDAWPLRQQMERAEAVKCPSAPAQLAGMKKAGEMDHLNPLDDSPFYSYESLCEIPFGLFSLYVT